VAVAAVVAVTLFAATIFEQRTAALAARKESAAEQRLKLIEDQSLRQQRDVMDAYFKLAGSQGIPAALETYRTALVSARAFERTHAALPEAALFVARAAMKVGDASREEALDRFTEARSRLEPLETAAPGDYFAALEGLGRAQLHNRDVLGSLASFSRALQAAEARGNLRDLASANYWVGTVLAYNGETEAGAAKLRKAFELYRDLAGGRVNAAEDSPAGYRKALADLAAQAPPDLRQTIQSQLREFTPD